MTDKYILDGHTPVLETDLLKWAHWFETGNRFVGQTKIGLLGKIRVSTIFLGIDHRCGEGPPLLFETMVFGGKYDQDMMRYSTWEQAIAGHRAMIDKVRGKKDAMTLIEAGQPV